MSSATPPVYGAPCWVHLAARDLDSAQDFYAATLGWRFATSELGPEFSVAMVGDEPVAGIGTMQATLGMPVAWTPYFLVPSADTTAARVAERSATVAVGPLTLATGRASLASDPAGATFGFWEGELPSGRPTRGDTAPQLELRTRDAFAMAIFYAEVFEWASGDQQRCDVAYEHGAVTVLVGEHVVATLRGGAVEAAPDPRIQPRWHVAFPVADVAETVRAATSAGGSIATEPGDTPFGHSAVLRDPDGGFFTVTQNTQHTS
ncbi:VOC family protein [Streptomyces oceani]|uniref:Bleomycin resistance protein n=1 Tax=Streptomyces oceani TaxID=1075402 RepID=A0A1E7KJT8_9ACTN|nr:VOC family protein [Streptomyces oceani]OEV04180.1 bleomycin resistance protein [Streptomyces oceani]